MKQVSDIDIWTEQHLNGNTPQLSELRCGQKKRRGDKNWTTTCSESEMNIHCFSLPL